ncbi:MAG: histidinol-phosphatase HisJ family protein [Peptococcales bacterium]|jgi:histidinol-phosphatase (PHP family)
MHYLVDYHVHTNNSFDSSVKMLDYCELATQIGLREIVFTEHFDLNPVDKGLGYFNYDEYSQEIEECREKYEGRLIIKKGLELGEPHLYIEEHTNYLQEKDFDFLLGSVHFIGEEVLHRDYASDEDEREVYLTYFTQVFETAKHGTYQTLGHLDVLKRYVPNWFRKFVASDYEEVIREILKVVIQRDKGIEINTSGFRQGLEEPLPSVEIIRWYRELGGEIITIGSDSHHLRHLGLGLKHGIAILKEIGFKGIYTFTQGKPQFTGF